MLSVHSVVSFDFATSQLPGWHTTIFPPYFVAGAIFSGFAMVLTLLHPAAATCSTCKHIITQEHIDAMCKIMLATGMMVGYAYAMEFFIAWYSGNPYEQFTFINRAFGPFWWAYFLMVSCNVIMPAVLLVQEGPQQQRADLVPLHLHQHRHVVRALRHHRDVARAVVPAVARGATTSPTRYDVGVFVGTIGMFFTFFLLFFRFLPVVAISEVKGASPEAHAGKPGTKGAH